MRWLFGEYRPRSRCCWVPFLSAACLIVVVVMTANELLASHLAAVNPEPLLSTGIRELDDLVGGLVAGQVWIVISRPGEGKTTFVAQIAIGLAAARAPRQLATPREPAAWIASRFIAQLGLHPLGSVSRNEAKHRGAHTLGRERLQSIHLDVWPSDGPREFIPESDPWPSPEQGAPPAALIVDDADLVSGLTPTRVGALAAAGILVVISLPRELVALGDQDEAPLDPAWARVADVILEVRHRGLAAPADAPRPGEADLLVLRNRWGPCRTVTAIHQAHYSRFVDPQG